MITIYRARTVHTLTEHQGDAVAVLDGHVLTVGTFAELSAHHPDATVVDLGDGTLTPGWTDSHMHPLRGAEATDGADLSGCRDEADLETVLRDHWSRTSRERDWLIGWGLNPNAFADEPTGAVLDRVAPGVPGFMTMFDAHSLVASSAALDLAAIDGPRSFPDGSSVVVDPEGRPTGYILEPMAMQLVRGLVPPMSFDRRLRLFVGNLLAIAGTGFVAGHALDFGGEDALDLLRAAAAMPGGLPLDLTISPILGPTDLDAGIERVTSWQGLEGDRWRVSGVKLFMDGTIDGGTAWLYEPDTCGESTAPLWLDPQQYRTAVTRLDQAGVPTRTHAIGDRAVDYVAETLGALGSGVPHRVEHLETVTDEVLDTLAAHGIPVSMQPTHCTRFVEPDGSDNWSVRLGTERAGRGWRTRDVRDRGITLALGSDWPVAPSDAREIFAAAQLRHQPDGPTLPIQSDQALTARQALEGFTTHAAASIGAPSPGLAPGAPATFSAFSKDPLATAPVDFAQAKVLLTAITGVHVIDPLGVA